MRILPARRLALSGHAATYRCRSADCPCLPSFPHALWCPRRVLPPQHSFGPRPAGDEPGGVTPADGGMCAPALASPGVVAGRVGLATARPGRTRPAQPRHCGQRGRRPSGHDRLGSFRPLDGRGHVRPRQHVAQAGDPQPQRVTYGPTGLAWVHSYWDTWENAESRLTAAWVFPDGRHPAIWAWAWCQSAAHEASCAVKGRLAAAMRRGRGVLGLPTGTGPMSPYRVRRSVGHACRLPWGARRSSRSGAASTASQELESARGRGGYVRIQLAVNTPLSQIKPHLHA
jgi:hypothetical protein